MVLVGVDHCFHLRANVISTGYSKADTLNLAPRCGQ